MAVDSPNSLTGWTSEQWGLVKKTVTDEVNKASVAGSFLPCYGPLSNSAEVVRRQKLLEDGSEKVASQFAALRVDNEETLRLFTAAVYVQLKQQQIAQENLDDALLAFRRAANLLARAEDAIVFNGYPIQSPAPKLPEQVRVTGGESNYPGLIKEGNNDCLKIPPDYVDRRRKNLVSAIAEAISVLESQGNLGPFACVMGTRAFVAARTPEEKSLVLPSDRIEPMLGMALMRSGTMPENQVTVVSLAGDPIDLVVATAPTAQFLYLTDEARYVFRVYERFVLRIKEPCSVFSFTFDDGQDGGTAGATPASPAKAPS